MKGQELSKDTTAVLLLCGHFGKASANSAKVLSRAEYGRLAGWLNARKLRPKDLLDMERLDLRPLAEIEIDLARLRALLQRGTALALSVEKWLRSGLWVLSRSDDDYPRRLKKRFGADAPVLLYGAGEPALLERGGLAIVGSRNADDMALSFAQDMAAVCAQEEIGVVSGGARGVDAAAMQGASEAGGVVIGVLADSLLQALRRREQRVGIEERRLVLVSPYHPEAGFEVSHAMARNRYIYGLADHALIVRSDLKKGGTWAGAVENLKAGWVPLFVRAAPDAAGNGALIKNGAIPFGYEAREHTDLRRYLTDGVLVARHPEPAEGLTPAEGAVVREGSVSYLARADAAVTKPAQTLDLYLEFLRRLPTVFEERALAQRDISKALGLQPSQAKAWTDRAEKEGAVERQGTKGKYRLAQRRLF